MRFLSQEMAKSRVKAFIESISIASTVAVLVSLIDLFHWVPYAYRGDIPIAHLLERWSLWVYPAALSIFLLLLPFARRAQENEPH